MKLMVYYLKKSKKIARGAIPPTKHELTKLALRLYHKIIQFTSYETVCLIIFKKYIQNR